MYFDVQIKKTNAKIKKTSKIEKSNNSTFFILIHEIMKFRNIGCSIFACYRCWLSPFFNVCNSRTSRHKFRSSLFSLIRYFTPLNFDHSSIYSRYKFMSTTAFLFDPLKTFLRMTFLHLTLVNFEFCYLGHSNFCQNSTQKSGWKILKKLFKKIRECTTHMD